MCSLCKHPLRVLWLSEPAFLEGTGREGARHSTDHSNALGVMHRGVHPGHTGVVSRDIHLSLGRDTWSPAQTMSGGGAEWC